MSNTWGSEIRLSIFGESHGSGIGMILDGIEPGVQLNLEMIKQQMARRAPGGSLSTPRKEADEVEFLSGIVENVTCGSPICGIIRNTNTKSKDYSKTKDWLRPSHADYTAMIKYCGFADYRGGGHFSGRITAPLVLAGSICGQALQQKCDLQIGSHIVRLGEYEEQRWHYIDPDQLKHCEASRIPCQSPEKVTEIIENVRREADSIGGMVETAITGIPAGLGDPFFDSLESRLAHLLFSIPAVKSVSFGAGIQFAAMRGSEANDLFGIQDESIYTKTNNNGGILGGISTGMPIVFQTVLKPTPSIGRPQMSVNVNTMQEEENQIIGRHDPCIGLRAVPVIEAAAKIALYDAWKGNRSLA